MENSLARSLKNMCQYCKTKPSNCNKKKCVRYNDFKWLIEKDIPVELEVFPNATGTYKCPRCSKLYYKKNITNYCCDCGLRFKKPE